MDHLEKTVQLEKLNKQKTATIPSSYKRPPAPPSVATSIEKSTNLNFDLPNLDGNPWENITK